MEHPEKDTFQPWQVEDLRDESLDAIFDRLKVLGVLLDSEGFLSYADTIDTPEDLTDLLTEDAESVQMHDKVYLLLFELWRRLLPEKQSLSIFCDELDRRIFLYDQGQIQSDENIQDALANLEEILDENTDIGAEPQDVFRSLSEYLANDLESFLFDYITEQMDAGYEYYATELLEGFYPYMTDLKWFDFLRARLVFSEDVNLANQIISLIASELKQEPDLDLQIEILRFMVQTGDRSIFRGLVETTLEQLETEEDFSELMEIVADYYRRLDQEDLESAIEKIMIRRQGKTKTSRFDKEDPDLLILRKLMKLSK